MKKALLIILFVCLTTMAVAQETGFERFKVGVAAYSGATIFAESHDQQGFWCAGMLHVSSRIAVRPQIMLYFRNREDKEIEPTPGTDHSDDKIFGAGLDFLYYWPIDNKSLYYVGPAVRYLKYFENDEFYTGADDDEIYHFIRPICPVNEEGTVFDALQIMVERGAATVPIVDERDFLKGLLTFGQLNSFISREKERS